jgi:hypothetical protein
MYGLTTFCLNSVCRIATQYIGSTEFIVSICEGRSLCNHHPHHEPTQPPIIDQTPKQEGNSPRNVLNDACIQEWPDKQKFSWVGKPNRMSCSIWHNCLWKSSCIGHKFILLIPLQCVFLKVKILMFIIDGVRMSSEQNNWCSFFPGPF